ncbi:MAG: glycosyltransferase family 9 protein [Candidatus Caenarcaniphilales bacterium]|nr:glycosyltransferase family 9 protein [Candidatus Caenarcaniphilales bacterium]
MPPTQNPRILFVRLSALGDVIQTLPVVAAIRQKHPQAHIGWITDEDFADYLRAVPEIDQIIAIPRKGWLKMLINPLRWKELTQEIKEFKDQVQAGNYEVGIDVQGLLKTALLLYLTGLKRRIGFDHWREWTGLFYTERYIKRQEYFDPEFYHIQHMFRLLEPLGCKPFDSKNVDFALASLSQEVISSIEKKLSVLKQKESLIGIILGTQWESKLWPLEHWQKLIKNIISQTDASVVLVGGKADSSKSEETINQILKEAPEQASCLLNLCGQTSFFELQGLLSKMQIVIGADTAPVHLAGAVGTPLVISLFGPTASRRTAPVGKEEIQVLRTKLDLSCLPCHQRVCKIEDKNLCMNSISPEEVFKVIKDFLR